MSIYSENIAAARPQRFLHCFTVLAIVIVLAGCATPPPPYVAKPVERPEAVHCFDSVGHTPGAKPFVLGGTCCCTPSAEVLADYKKHGHVQADMTLEDLVALYGKEGIKTELDHKGCNNLCKWGPHVVKGGKCMVPPTPGTYNFEEVRFGTRYVKGEEAKKDKPSGNCCTIPSVPPTIGATATGN